MTDRIDRERYIPTASTISGVSLQVKNKNNSSYLLSWMMR